MAGASHPTKASSRNDSTPEQEEIVAALCAEAPTDAVRDCLRKYDPKKMQWQIEASFKQVKKQVLVETLGYLGVPGMDQYKADVLPHELLCRVQNLFPDVCHLCKGGYCIKLKDKPIVSCAFCGQGCHNECVLQLLGITEADRNETNQFGAALLIPNAAVGLVYMCEYCRDDKIPKKEVLKTKSSTKKSSHIPPSDPSSSNSTAEAGQSSSVQIQQNGSNSTEPPEISSIDQQITDSNENGSRSVQERDSRRGEYTHASENLNGARNERNVILICKHYRLGRCKHGISGKADGNCAYQHPKPCSKYMANGTRNHGGCNQGRNCNFFHPTVCNTSLRQRSCFRENCKFLHIRGTKRNRDQESNSSEQTRSTQIKQSSDGQSSQRDNSMPVQSPFLCHIKELQNQLMAITTKLGEMDRNYSVLLQQHPMMLNQNLSSSPIIPQFSHYPQPHLYQPQQLTKYQQPTRGGLLPTPLTIHPAQ